MAPNTTLFTIIGIILLATMAVGMFVSQSRHKALELRNNQIRMLGLQQRRLQNLIRTIPPNYLSIELRDFLYQALLQNLKSQLELVNDKNNLLKDDYERISAEKDRVKQNPPKTNGEKYSADQTSIYRGLLKSVHQFIKRNYETGRLKKADAEKMIKQVELKLIETAVDFFVLVGDERRQSNDYRQSRNAFLKAIDVIEQSPHADEFKQESMKIKASLNQITEMWRESREQASKIGAEKLAGELEHFVEDQDSWKKKQTYE